jgi:hypothetical protein
MNITLPLTSSRSPLWEGKLIYPVITWKCVHNDPKNRSSPENCSQVITTGCTLKGRLTVAPPVPDLEKCAACAVNYSAIHNCSAVQRQQACTLPPGLRRSDETKPIVCNEALMRRTCFPKPVKPPAKLSASSSQCVTFVLAPREKTEFVDVGKLIDTMNHATWNLPAGNYTITLALKDAEHGKMRTLGVFPSNNAPLQILTDASTRASRRMRVRASDFWELYPKLKAVKKTLAVKCPGCKPPTDVPIFASTFQRDIPQGGFSPKGGTGQPDPKYKAAQAEFESMFAISPTDVNSGVCANRSQLCVSKDAWRTDWGYLDLRGFVPKTPTASSADEVDVTCEVDGRASLCAEGIDNQDVNLRPYGALTNRRSPGMTLAAKLQTYIDAGVAGKIRAIKLGDEISLPRPSGNDTDAMFHTWAKQQGLAPKDIGCTGFDPSCKWNVSIATVHSNAALYYYSNKYKNDFGIHSGYKNATAIINKMLPNALAGANYGPTVCAVKGGSCMSYLPETFKWIRAFRAGTFTLP